MVFFSKTSKLFLFQGLWVVAGFQVIQGETGIIPPKVQYFVDTSRQLTELLDRILIQKNQILNDEDKARIQKVYQLIDQSLLKELKECDFLKNIDVAELEK